MTQKLDDIKETGKNPALRVEMSTVSVFICKKNITQAKWNKCFKLNMYKSIDENGTVTMGIGQFAKRWPVRSLNIQIYAKKWQMVTCRKGELDSSICIAPSG